MAEAVLQPTTTTDNLSFRMIALGLLLVTVVVIAALLFIRFAALQSDDALLADSTVGELAMWMADQTEEEEIESILGRLAQRWADARGEEVLEPDVALNAAKTGLLISTGAVIMMAAGSLLALFIAPNVFRSVGLLTLLSVAALLFIVPVLDGDSTQWLILAAITVLLIALFQAPGRVTRILGFFVMLSLLLVVWETSKALAESVNYNVLLTRPAWEYETYPTTDAALSALLEGETDAIFLDRRDLNELMPSYPVGSAEPAGFPYPDLRYLDNIERRSGIGFFSILPEFRGRLAAAVRAEDAASYQSISDFESVNVATVSDSFAETGYLAEPRNLVLADLKILNNVNLPHLQTIAEAFLQPARRNGAQLLVRILADAGLYTFSEAFFGFTFGALLGFVLGTVFAHSVIMERSLLPYVVASQTVPILAIAPMVVIWLGASQTSVSVIAAYLTFFPVTINTLRGLQSPKATQVDLLRSYAASNWTILWKLRVPAALPYIFTALKISATASVVGAIIGELPSGIGDGLGRAILDFSSDYSLISTPKLWAAIVMAAFVGIIFFVAVSLVERLVLGRYIRNL
jgi:NitT/TauT family transport system permease protein